MVIYDQSTFPNMFATTAEKSENPLIGIYKLTAPNGKVYIGKSKNILNRFKTYSKVKSNDNKQKRLYSSINKYGWEGFTKEIVEQVTTEELDKKEIYWIDFYKCNYNKHPESNGLNLADGGVGSRGFKHTVGSIEQIRKSKEANPNSNYNWINLDTGIFYQTAKEAAKAHGHTLSQILYWSIGRVNPKKPIFKVEKAEIMLKRWKSGEFKKVRVVSEEFCKLMSKSRKGIKLTEIEKINRAINRARNKEGKWKAKRCPPPPQTDEHKRKVRESLIGRKVSLETRHKTRMSNPKILILLDKATGVYYESLYEASENFKINKITLYDQLVGRTKKKSTNLIIT